MGVNYFPNKNIYLQFQDLIHPNFYYSFKMKDK